MSHSVEPGCCWSVFGPNLWGLLPRKWFCRIQMALDCCLHLHDLQMSRSRQSGKDWGPHLDHDSDLVNIHLLALLNIFIAQCYHLRQCYPSASAKLTPLRAFLVYESHTAHQGCQSPAFLVHLPLAWVWAPNWSACRQCSDFSCHFAHSSCSLHSSFWYILCTFWFWHCWSVNRSHLSFHWVSLRSGASAAFVCGSL